jgi:hypothetical protein
VLFKTMPPGFTKYLGMNYNLYRQPASAEEGVTGGQRGASNSVFNVPVN